jgi:ankyrin repeat protein
MKIVILALLLTLATATLGATPSDVANAAERGDTTAVIALLDRKADVNAPQAGGTTALHWAVYRGDLEIADLLIRAGANVNAANREGDTPLAMASTYGNAPIIDHLLKAGANAKQAGPAGRTLLMLAARSGSIDAIKLLIDAGINVNAKETSRGTTALMWAAEQGHPLAVKALVDAGADVSFRSAGAGLPTPYMASTVLTLTPFDRAGGATVPQGGRYPVPATPTTAAAPVEDEGPVAGVRGTGGGGLTALVFAAREGDIESARILLDARADVNQITEFGWSPLLVATENRNYQLGKLLIERGANVNLANNHGWSPLYLATDNRNIEGGDYPVPEPDMDHLEFIRLLLDHGAKVNARVLEGAPKSHSTLTRTIFTMQWFFEEGATPFVRAAQSGDIVLMKILLERGADPKIPTSFGDTALTAAAGIGWVEGVTHEWSPQQSAEAVKLLLDLGLNPNAANQDGRTPLMASAHKGRTESIQLLVDRGAKLETRDKGSRDTHIVDLSGHGGWQAIDYADGLVRVGVQSANAHPEASALLRKLMNQAGLPVPPIDRLLDYVCAVEGPLCQNPKK